jgi:hypothetical protein
MDDPLADMVRSGYDALGYLMGAAALGWVGLVGLAVVAAVLHGILIGHMRR